MTTLAASIIVHNDFSHIRSALASILNGTKHQLTIHVTVNSGPPEQADALRAEFPQVVIHTNIQPCGFASNHNAILRLVQTDYVALLNDDIEGAPRMLDILVDYMERNGDVGLVSPHVINPDGTPQIMAYSDPSLLRMIYKVSGLGYLTRHGSGLRRAVVGSILGRFFRTASLHTYAETREVPVVVGVAMLVRRAAYQEAGVMDEDTLVYGEEVAWHWRLRQYGWKIVLVADTWVTHFNAEQPLRGRMLVEHRKGMLNYFARHRPAWQALVLRGAILILHGIRGAGFVFFDPNRATTEWQTALTALRFRPRR